MYRRVIVGAGFTPALQIPSKNCETIRREAMYRRVIVGAGFTPALQIPSKLRGTKQCIDVLL